MSAGRKGQAGDFCRPLKDMDVQHVYLDAPLKAQRRPWDARAVEIWVGVTCLVAGAGGLLVMTAVAMGWVR